MRTNRDLSLAASARRGQLVDCAVDALCAVGFAGTSIGEVARRAGVSKGVVTYHFPTKDALLKQVVTELYERAGRQIAAATSLDPSLTVAVEAGSPDAGAEAAGSSVSWRILHGYITSNLAFVAQNRRHVRAAMEVLGNLRSTDGSLEFAPKGPDPVTAHLEGLIRDGIQRGDFAAVDPSAMAVIIRSVIDTVAARSAADPDFDQAALTETLLTIAARTLEVAR
ncbi:TetR/AcrR family transcriptional regulator [Kribbella sp. NPDC048915]|uniref:TetR/AcrR family transcriptional regulator n=1 Tax=Kribbella sp. NPDC048915 TaxID=3155148 RepID=UPI0033FCD246